MSGRQPRALTELTIAIDAADRMGMRQVAWQARATMARALDGLGRTAKAEAARQAARRIAEELAAEIGQPEQRAAFEEHASRTLSHAQTATA